MRFIDIETGATVNLDYLKEEWQALRRTEPENHAMNFTTELLEIMLATVNGRNDIDIDGTTPREIDRIIRRLRAVVNNRTAGQ